MSRSTVALLALLTIPAMTASGGDVRLWQWPVGYQPVEVAAIPVVMDVGFWMRVWDPGAIQLRQQTMRTYTGCVNLRMECNFNAWLSWSITPTGAVPGRYSCTLDPQDVYAPGCPPYEMPTLCVTLDEADLRLQPGGARSVHVATVVLRVIPRL
jgi:hypothetical protein